MDAADRIRKLRLEKGLSQEELGRAIGVPEGQQRQRISKIERKYTKLNAATLAKIAGALHVTTTELQPAEGPGRPTEGPVRRKKGRSVELFASPANDIDVIPIVSFEQGQRRVDGYSPRPPSLLGVRDAYAIYVRDEGMEPRYCKGWLLYINPTKPAGPGRDAIIFRNSDSAAVIRHLERGSDGRLVARPLAEGHEAVTEDDIREMNLIVGLDQEG